MALTIPKGIKIGAPTEEIRMVWKVTLGMKHPVCSSQCTTTFDAFRFLNEAGLIEHWMESEMDKVL